jgi:hypothetical protein
MGLSGDRTLFARLCALVLALFLSFGWQAQSAAYAVLAHEAIIDSAWDANIRPLLVNRFPNATEDELKEAHGYATRSRAALTAWQISRPPAERLICKEDARSLREDQRMSTANGKK